MFGEDGISSVSQSMHIPAQTWENFENGVAIPAWRCSVGLACCDVATYGAPQTPPTAAASYSQETRTMVVRKRLFVAKDEQGTPYVIDEFQEIIRAPRGSIDGATTLKTLRGQHVNRKKKGEYEIV